MKNELMYGPSLMETCIEIHEMDQKMFETLIEFDFMSENNLRTMNESEAIAINEAMDKEKNKNIINKIILIIDKAIKGIKTSFSIVIEKILETLKIDDRIRKKYDKVLTMDNLEGFKGIKNYAFPILQNNYFKEFLEDGYEFSKNILKIKNVGSDSETLNKVRNYIAYYLSDSNDMDDLKNMQLFEPKQKLFVPDEKHLFFIKDSYNNYYKIIKQIKDYSISVTNLLTSWKIVLKSKQEESLECQELYSMMSKALKNIVKSCNFQINLIKRQFGAFRKAYIILGKYAYKKANGKENESSVEEAVDFAISESSDMFVLEM